MIKTWSHSRPVDFETRRIARTPRMSRKCRNWNARCHRERPSTRMIVVLCVHEECEAFVRGLGPLPKRSRKIS